MKRRVGMKKRLKEFFEKQKRKAYRDEEIGMLILVPAYVIACIFILHYGDEHIAECDKAVAQVMARVNMERRPPIDKMMDEYIDNLLANEKQGFVPRTLEKIACRE